MTRSSKMLTLSNSRHLPLIKNLTYLQQQRYSFGNSDEAEAEVHNFLLSLASAKVQTFPKDH